MKDVLKKLFKNFAVLLLISAILGIIVGIAVGEKASVLSPFGTVFTRLLGMVVPVLVFFSISSSFANIGDAKKLTRWAGKVIGYFLLTTFIGTLIGIACGLIFKPGQGLTLPDAEYEVTTITAQMFIDWLPSNAVGCLAEGNTIQIVFLSIFVGLGFAVHIVLCYFGMIKFIAKLNPIKFTKKLFPALITAFTTTSSAGTMPVTLQCTKDIGVDDEVADFGIPLGVTFNMDSMAVEIPLYIMLGMYAVGTAPNVGQLILFALMGVAFSIGCAGVPGGGLAIAVILVNAFGLPVEVVGWIAAVFFYLDVTGTTMNIWGDAVCTAIVAKSEGLFDEEKFNA